MKSICLFLLLSFFNITYGQQHRAIGTPFAYSSFYSNPFLTDCRTRIKKVHDLDFSEFHFIVEETNDQLFKCYGKKASPYNDRSLIHEIEDDYHPRILQGMQHKIISDLVSLGFVEGQSAPKKTIVIKPTIEVFAAYYGKPAEGLVPWTKVKISIKVELGDTLRIDKSYERYHESSILDPIGCGWEMKAGLLDFAMATCLRETLNQFYADLFKLLKPSMLVVTGDVVDSLTNKKLTAHIAFKSDTVYSANATNGNFKIKVPKTLVMVAIDVPNYKPYRRRFDLTNVKDAKGWIFKMTPIIKPTAIIAGHVVDSLTNKELTAQVKFKSDALYSAISTNGYFKMEIPKSVTIVSIALPNYKSYSRKLDLPTIAKSNNLVIRMIPRGGPEAPSFNSVLFHVGTTDILDESISKLDEVASFLISEQEAMIELRGYTDTLGDSEKDLELSNERVDTITSYLISKGVNAERINGIGFGDTMPVYKGKSEVGRKLNRRVEFVITYEQKSNQ